MLSPKIAQSGVVSPNGHRFKIAASYYDRRLLEWIPGMFNTTGEDERQKALTSKEDMGANYKDAARIDICVRTFQ